MKGIISDGNLELNTQTHTFIDTHIKMKNSRNLLAHKLRNAPGEI